LHLHQAQVRDGDEGFYLESELLVWDGTKETLKSPGPVFILWEGLEIHAAEMSMESQTNLLYLKDDVRIQDGQMRWRLDEAVYDLEREFMDFYGRVVLEREDGDDE